MSSKGICGTSKLHVKSVGVIECKGVNGEIT